MDAELDFGLLGRLAVGSGAINVRDATKAASEGQKNDRTSMVFFTDDKSSNRLFAHGPATFTLSPQDARVTLGKNDRGYPFAVFPDGKTDYDTRVAEYSRSFSAHFPGAKPGLIVQFFAQEMAKIADMASELHGNDLNCLKRVCDPYDKTSTVSCMAYSVRGKPESDVPEMTEAGQAVLAIFERIKVTLTKKIKEFVARNQANLLDWCQVMTDGQIRNMLEIMTDVSVCGMHPLPQIYSGDKAEPLSASEIRQLIDQQTSSTMLYIGVVFEMKTYVGAGKPTVALYPVSMCVAGTVPRPSIARGVDIGAVSADQCELAAERFRLEYKAACGGAIMPAASLAIETAELSAACMADDEPNAKRVCTGEEECI